MDVRFLRQLWSIVESTPKQRISALDDSGVLCWLTDLLKADPTFDTNYLPMASDYIQTRMPLIRDLAGQS